MPDNDTRPVALIVMGPSGVGKTTTAKLLSERLDWPFGEADEYHPKANIEKMSAGQPLNDDDRAPWLAALRDHISQEADRGRSLVMTCSALKVKYRDTLRAAHARVRFVALTADPETVGERMAKRQGHYMPASLLKSQFEALEPLRDAEDGIVVHVDAPPNVVVDRALNELGIRPAGVR